MIKLKPDYVVPNPKLGIKQVTDLINTLNKAKQSKESQLNMSDWVSEADFDDDHWCGYSCCICGYQAFDKLDNFTRAQSTKKERGITCRVDYDDIAIGIAIDLDLSLGRCFAESIYLAEARDRANRAFYLIENIEDFKHLNEDHDSFDYAIEYLEAVKAGLEHYIETRGEE